MHSRRLREGVPGYRAGPGTGLIFDLRASWIGGSLSKRPWCPENRVRYTVNKIIVAVRRVLREARRLGLVSFEVVVISVLPDVRRSRRSFFQPISSTGSGTSPTCGGHIVTIIHHKRRMWDQTGVISGSNGWPPVW